LIGKSIGELPREGPAEEARQKLQRALIINGNDERVLALMAAYYLLVGDLPEAEGFFNRAAELKPHDPIFWNNRGLLSQAQGNTSLAITYWKQALKFASKSPREVRLQILGSLADGYEANGDYKLAFETERERTKILNSGKPGSGGGGGSCFKCVMTPM